MIPGLFLRTPGHPGVPRDNPKILIQKYSISLFVHAKQLDEPSACVFTQLPQFTVECPKDTYVNVSRVCQSTWHGQAPAYPAEPALPGDIRQNFLRRSSFSWFFRGAESTKFQFCDKMLKMASFRICLLLSFCLGQTAGMWVFFSCALTKKKRN